ncbi:major facilitator superfamily domain-containing protein [Xylaria intraflava]|nr:major facilitator superfamily domain-containing protein [Xylaria intraflava]
MPAQLPPDGRDHHDEIAESTERTALIPRVSDGYGSRAGGQGSWGRAYSIASLAKFVPMARKPSSIMVILCGIIFVGSASGGFLNMSMTRIFEDILCRQYYDRVSSDDGPAESMCKVDAIQSKLAYLLAIMASLNAGISVLFALPWGIVADRFGRRPVFALGWAGMSIAILWIMIVGWFYQTLSPKLIWLSPLAYVLGGGNPVLAAMVNSIATDILPESERSVNFMRIHGASMVGNLISPALASIIMTSAGPWLPLFIAFLLTALPAPIIFFVPETLKRNHLEEDGEGSDDGMFKKRLMQSLGELGKSARVFASPSMTMILLITMMQLSLVLCTFQFLSQFASKRYNIPLAETGYIQSVYGIVFIAVSFFIMPFVSSFSLKRGLPAWLRFDDDKRRDLFFARFSFLASLLGTIIMALSPTLSGFVFGLVIIAFGVSGEGFLKNIATLYATAEQRSRLFTILGLSTIAGDLWISAALAKLFSLGMELGGTWIGLPYLGVSFICVLMFSMSLFVKIPRSYSTDRGPQSEEGLDSE